MLRFYTAGESHGQGLVAVLVGLPAGLAIDFAYVDRELKRRMGGYGRGGRMKIERDRAQFLSGVRHGRTIGSPITILIENQDWKNWTQAMAVEESPEASAQYRPLVQPRLLQGGVDFSIVIDDFINPSNVVILAVWMRTHAEADQISLGNFEPHIFPRQIEELICR